MDNQTTEPKQKQELFIKVYPGRLRKLITDHKLRRAEVAELLYLALYMDSERRCRPGKYDSAKKVGMKSGNWAREIHRRLKAKDALSWDFDHEFHSPRFLLPDCFELFKSGNSNNDTNTDSGGVRNPAPPPMRKTESGGSRNTVPEQDSPEEDTNRTKTTANRQTEAVPLKKLVTNLTTEQKTNLRKLLKNQVRETEAYLIATQYDSDTINEAISSTNSNTQNPGGFIRRVVEVVGGKPIQYPALNKTEVRATVAMVITGIKLSNRYLENDYFAPQENEATETEE